MLSRRSHVCPQHHSLYPGWPWPCPGLMFAHGITLYPGWPWPCPWNLLLSGLARSKLDYGCVVYGSASRSVLRTLDAVHHAGLHICLGAFHTFPVPHWLGVQLWSRMNLFLWLSALFQIWAHTLSVHWLWMFQQRTCPFPPKLPQELSLKIKLSAKIL